MNWCTIMPVLHLRGGDLLLRSNNGPTRNRTPANNQSNSSIQSDIIWRKNSIYTYIFVYLFIVKSTGFSCNFLTDLVSYYTSGVMHYYIILITDSSCS